MDNEGTIEVDLSNFRIVKDESPCWVYFIVDEGFHVCKIGRTYDVRLRLKQLQHANPAELRVARVMPCKDEDDSIRLEAKMHKVFAGSRIRGEWFEIEGDLRKYLMSEGVTSAFMPAKK